MQRSRPLAAAAALVLLAACARQPGLDQVPSPLPLSHAPRPTTGAIGAADLMTRLYVFADDSMQGRETGTVGHLKSTQYIADQLRALGLEPAGDGGTYFQNVPMIRRALDPQSSITVDGTTLRAGTDFVSSARGVTRGIDGAQVIFGGAALDTTNLLAPGQVRGKLLVLRSAATQVGPAQLVGLQRSPAFQQYLRMVGEAAGVATVGELAPQVVRAAMTPREGDVFMAPGSGAAAPAAQPLTLVVTPRAAELLLGAPLDGIVKGAAGRTVAASVRFVDTPAPARNVVAVLRGRDTALRDEYVAIGAHNDHVGVSPARPVDHDSLHLANQARYRITSQVPRGQRPTAEQQARLDAIRVNLDSVRRIRTPRLDSIRNGADDDGSGSVTALEVAEAFAAGPRPRRSLLFVWHTGEEKGLLGSRWFSEHPTVPRDRIVAQLNMDMVGRGGAADMPGGSPDYLALVGSRRLSTELGDLVEAVNRAQPRPLAIDYSWDANGHPENVYCRSDHYHYARWGIPVVFFTTALHGDYHQVTDEPQYIDYPHMARVARLVHGVAERVANLDHRPAVDKPKPDPTGACRQ